MSRKILSKMSNIFHKTYDKSKVLQRQKNNIYKNIKIYNKNYIKKNNEYNKY